MPMAPHSTPPMMSLPDGWIQQYDPKYKHPFWVDTRAKPPRAIWVHPYEDKQFLAEHPEVGANEETSPASDLDAPPSYDVVTEGHTSERREKSGSCKPPDPPDAVSAGASGQMECKRGVFGKLKDKAIGTKEEREEQKRIRAERAARAEERARQARRRQLQEREAYMRAHGGYAPYHPGSAAAYPTGYESYGPAPARPGVGFGGVDNTAALLLGGLAGGLLLGDIFGGGF